jgi:hypothetical protein
VTICHRTASRSNPYELISVAQSAVDGRGRGDHYLEHRGPIGPIPVGEWGDIIPPLPGVHTGLNWTAAGIAIYQASCSTATTTTTTTTTTVAPTSTVISNCEDYTPTGLTVSPGNVNPGATITVSGTGTPGTTVVIVLRRPNGQVVGSSVSVVVPPSGTWSVQITIPASAPLGALDVVASVPPCTTATTVRIVVSNGGGPGAQVGGIAVSQEPPVAGDATVRRPTGAAVAGSTLARTGSDSRSLAITGAIVLAVGVAMVLAGRRRLRPSRRPA